MTTENNHIDRLFKEKLGNFEKNPPADLLTRVNAQIVSEHKSAQIRYLKTFASIAAAVVLILMAGWFTLDQEQNQVVSNEVSQPAPVEKSAATVTPEKQLPEQQLSQNTATVSQAKPEKTASASAARQRSRSSRPTTAGQTASQPVIVSTTPTDAGTAMAAGKPSGEQPQVNQPGNKASADTRKKEPSSFPKQEPSRSENKSYYSVNPGAAPVTPKADMSLKQWSLKAEIASTVTAMQHFSSENPDSKSASTVGGGMIASLRVSRKVTISSGIRYAQMKQGTHSTYTMTNTAGITYLQPVEKKGNITRDVSLKLPAVSSIVYSNGMKTNPENTFVSDISQQFQYLEVPVQANYLLLDKKFTVGVTGGLSTNFLIGNKASITENGIKLSTGATGNLRDVIYAGSAGLELGYDLGKRMVLTLEPRVKQYLHSVSSNDLVNVKPLQFGIYTGISYSFE